MKLSWQVSSYDIKSLQKLLHTLRISDKDTLIEGFDSEITKRINLPESDNKIQLTKILSYVAKLVHMAKNELDDGSMQIVMDYVGDEPLLGLIEDSPADLALI